MDQEQKKRLDDAWREAKAHNYDVALTLCQKALAQTPASHDVLKTRAHIYAHKGDFAEAIKDMNTILSVDTKQPDDYFSRGRWYLDSGDFQAAISDMSKTISLGDELNSDYYTESAYFFRALAFLRLGRLREAVADCERVRDDFLVYVWSGRVSKSDIIEQAKDGMAL